MTFFTIFESNQFLKDIEDIAYWILISNIEQSESLAERKADEFQAQLINLKERLQEFPEMGEMDIILGVRKFPIYEGRYSVKWIANRSNKSVTLLAISDSKYPKNIKTYLINDEDL